MLGCCIFSSPINLGPLINGAGFKRVLVTIPRVLSNFEPREAASLQSVRPVESALFNLKGRVSRDFQPLFDDSNPSGPLNANLVWNLPRYANFQETPRYASHCGVRLCGVHHTAKSELKKKYIKQNISKHAAVCNPHSPKSNSNFRDRT